MKRFKLGIIGKVYEIDIEKLDDRSFYMIVNNKKYEAQIEDASGKAMLVAVDGGLYNVELEGEPSTEKMNIKVNNRERIVESKELLGASEIIPQKTVSIGSDTELIPEEEKETRGPAAMINAILAPLPGKVVAVKVNVDDQVRAGDVVVILEAMKMENEIVSNRDGEITEIRVKEGDTVDADDVLVVVG